MLTLRHAVVLLGLFLHANALPLQVNTTTHKKPHIILLVLDDIGWGDFGFHGSDFPTPHIDDLAKTGVELDRAYAMPQCSPTRSAIMTGRYAFRTGLQHWNTIFPGGTAGIPKDVPTVAHMMKDAGYATHAIGKWHLGYSDWSQTPTGKGFDSYVGYLQGQTDYYNRTLPACKDPECIYKVDKGAASPFGQYAAGYDFWKNEQPFTEDIGKYTMVSYMDRFREIVAPYNTSSPPDPLFLYFAEQQLHIPLQAPPEAKHLEACRGVTGGSETVNRTILCSMASKLDESVGELVSELKAHGMWEDTIIWAFSDNGGMTAWGTDFPASASSNWPLRGGKTTTFEGGVRSVSFVNGGALAAGVRGTKRSELLHAVDIFPTLAALAGANVSKYPSLDGLDAWPTITGSMPHNRTELPLQIAVNEDLTLVGGKLPCLGKKCNVPNFTALIQWPYKLLLGSTYFIFPGEIADRGGYWTIENYTYIPPPNTVLQEYTQLYNLEEDEVEAHNLATAHPEIVATMTTRIQDLWLSKKHGYTRPQLNLPMQIANPRFHNWTWTPFNPFGSGKTLKLWREEMY